MHTLERIKELVAKNNKIRRAIIKLFIPLMRSKLLQLENTFLPGFTVITWTSMQIPEYFENIEVNLAQVNRFIKEVCESESCIDFIYRNIILYM